MRMIIYLQAVSIGLGVLFDIAYLPSQKKILGE